MYKRKQVRAKPHFVEIFSPNTLISDTNLKIIVEKKNQTNIKEQVFSLVRKYRSNNFSIVNFLSLFENVFFFFKLLMLDIKIGKTLF